MAARRRNSTSSLSSLHAYTHTCPHLTAFYSIKLHIDRRVKICQNGIEKEIITKRKKVKHKYGRKGRKWHKGGEDGLIKKMQMYQKDLCYIYRSISWK